MYVRDPLDFARAGGGGRAFGTSVQARAVHTRGVSEASAFDLAADIGSARWWRDLAICVALIVVACLLAPRPRSLDGDVPVVIAGQESASARASRIAPLGLGGSGGRRAVATARAMPLAQAPERTRIQGVATLGTADTFDRLLLRAGANAQDAQTAAALLSGTALAPGLSVAVTLGARPDLLHPRPLDRVALRPTINLALAITRIDGRLTLSRTAIAIDRAPVRLVGVAGSGLYEAIRAAGVPAGAAADYLKAIAPRVPFGEVKPADTFDLIVERTRAAGGETRWGRLLFAGFGTGPHSLRLVRWAASGNEAWYDADGQTQRQGSFGMPVAGHITSGFGMRFHPILGFSRMHKGIDIGAPVGTPVFAVIDGAVLSAGWSGGYGNFIRLAHGGGVSSGYGHLSRIAVHAGEAVRRGQIIGYVGSTGMSTGPHLHWEIARGGVPIDPMRIAQSRITTLATNAMPALRARVAWLMGLKRGG